MPCLKCGNPGLVAKVKIPYDAPFVERHGTVKIGGARLHQLMIKSSWDREQNGEEKKLKGPIRCPMCKAEHVYYTGDTDPPLRLGKYAKWRKLVK